MSAPSAVRPIGRSPRSSSTMSVVPPSIALLATSRSHTLSKRRINAQQYLAAIRAFSLFALRYCGVCEAP